MRSSTGTRLPIITISATANAVSVAIGTPHPCAQGPEGISAIYRAAGTTMPPMAAAMGRAAERIEARWPTVSSRLISSPTTRKKMVKSPSVTQFSSDSSKLAPSKVKPKLCSQNAWKPGPNVELVTTMASTVASSSKMPADGAQAAKSSAAAAHAMTEPADHGIDKRTLVPGAVIAPPVDEEGRREHDAACARALLVRLDTRLGALDRFLSLDCVRRGPEVIGYGSEVVLRQLARSRHQGDMGVPERLGVGRTLDQIGGAAGKLVAGERPMPEHIAQAVAKLIAHFGDALVGRAAMGTGIAAIFNQRDGSVGRPEHVIARLVDRTVQPII